MATSSGFLPAGIGGWITPEVPTASRPELYGSGIDDRMGMGFMSALKNGMESPGWKTAILVMPLSAAVSILNSARRSEVGFVS